MTTPLLSQAPSLPLRQDDPLSFVLLLKVLVVTATLLALTYFGLRLYARRQAGAATPTARDGLHCIGAVRLSSKTRVYLLQANSTQVLVTEHPHGATVTALATASPASGPTAITQA